MPINTDKVYFYQIEVERDWDRGGAPTSFEIYSGYHLDYGYPSQGEAIAHLQDIAADHLESIASDVKAMGEGLGIDVESALQGIARNVAQLKGERC